MLQRQAGSVQFSSIQSLSRVRLFATPWIAPRQASLSITISRSSHVHRVSDAIHPSHPLSSPSPPAPHPSQHQSLCQWVNSSLELAKVLEFSFSILPSKEHPGLISFRMDWLDLFAVQGTLKSLLQHHSAKALKMLANFKNSAVATGLEMVSFHSIPKERQCQKIFKLLHNCTHLIC